MFHQEKTAKIVIELFGWLNTPRREQNFILYSEVDKTYETQ